MAHADWKRYYAVVWPEPPTLYLAKPLFWRKREDCQGYFERLLKAMPDHIKPIGIVRIRGNKRNPQLQRWLLEHSI